MNTKNYQKPTAEVIDLTVEDIMLISDESERDEIFSFNNVAPEIFN